MSKHEYRCLLFDIGKKINANELEKMVYLCKDDLPKGTRRDSFEDALALFDLLETKNRLGIDNTQILKGMLQNLPKKALLRKVEDFEIKRKGKNWLYLVAVSSSVRQVIKSGSYPRTSCSNGSTVQEGAECGQTFFSVFFFPPASRNKIALPESQVNLLRYAVTVISL